MNASEAVAHVFSAAAAGVAGGLQVERVGLGTDEEGRPTLDVYVDAPPGADARRAGVLAYALRGLPDEWIARVRVLDAGGRAAFLGGGRA